MNKLLPPSRILIVGHGSIGRRHLRLVRLSLPNADIRVLRRRSSCSVDYANGCFNNISDACNFKPEISIVANPAPFHVPISIELLSSGSHVIVEKPLATTTSEAKSILDVAQTYDRLIHVGYNLRFLDSLVFFRDFIRSNNLGRPLSVRCEVGQCLPSWRPGTDYRSGVSANRGLGGGVLLELSHEIDFLRWIFGDMVWVSAFLSRQSSLEIDVEDTAHLTLGFDPSSYGVGPLVFLTLDFIRHDKTRLCTVICEKGTIRWNGTTGIVDMYHEDNNDWQSLFESKQNRDDSYRLQFEHFIDCVLGNTLPMVGIPDGIAVLNVIDAARKSSSLYGARVKII